MTEAKANELASATARSGDVVVTQRGTLGQVGLIPRQPRYDRYVLSQSQMKITVNQDVATPEFVYAQFCTSATADRFIAQAMSSGVPHVNLTLLREFELLCPPPLIQKRFSTFTSDFAAQSLALRSQLDSLIQIRDVLRPKLITGEVDVSDLDLDAVVEAI